MRNPKCNQCSTRNSENENKGQRTTRVWKKSGKLYRVSEQGYECGNDCQRLLSGEDTKKKNYSIYLFQKSPKL